MSSRGKLMLQMVKEMSEETTECEPHSENNIKPKSQVFSLEPLQQENNNVTTSSIDSSHQNILVYSVAPLFEDDSEECNNAAKIISDSLDNQHDMHNVAGPSRGSYFYQHDDHEVELADDDSDDSSLIGESSGSEYEPSELENEENEPEDEQENEPDGEQENEQQIAHCNDTDCGVPKTNTNLTSRGTKRIKTFPVKEKTSRRRIRKPDTWKRRSAAIKRERGESYISYKNQSVPAKTFCSECLCNERCRLKCSTKFDLDSRKLIFEGFYKLDINAKNALLFRSITPLPIVRQRKNAIKHKTSSYKYSMILNNQQVFVCKSAFCALYQISRKKVDIIKEKLKTGSSVPSKDRRGIHTNRPHKINDDVEQAIMTHIKKFPSEESHYSRESNPHKRYLAPNLNMSLMYRLYIEECREQNMPGCFLVKKSTYSRIFSTKFNLSFSHPKSDTCSKCDAGNSNAEHEENVQLGFQLMSRDRERALKDEKVCYITVDLQQTMPLPKITTSKAFYLRQIWFYNLGIHVITTAGHKSVMQTWTEDIAGRGSTEVVSSLWNFVQTCENVKDKEQLVVWSDSCAGQNKNFQMICFFQLLILKGVFKVIDHKFPEVGHTYLDSDRDFGRIEKVLRKQSNIYTPDQYRQLIKTACTRNSTVNAMESYFRDAESLPNKMGLIHKKKNVLNEKVPFRDGIKWIRVVEFGSYLYKESYEYVPFKKVSLFKNNSPPANYVPPTDIEFPRIGHKRGNISEKKIANIREQMPFILEEHRGFYENIIGIQEEPKPKKARRTK
ncbi:unnamed protein product [Ceutorhynchus assimilis]|uniref:DUF7869 domain-containing protein n=1 Tax=Ceutorhynchus assimilis TaxID=467358 RepID=A0A9N9MF70_9CUCU|nr:unnamed protein product [Ceutorhynchus assimilis]